MGNGDSTVSKIVESKTLRTTTIIVALIMSIGGLVNSIFSVTYGVKENNRELTRVEGKVDASHTESKIINKEMDSRIDENHDAIIKDSAYQKIVDNNVLNIKDLSDDITEIKGDVKVLISRSN